MNSKFLNNLQSAIKFIEAGQLVRAEKLVTDILLNNSSNFDALYLKGLVLGLQSNHEDCKNYLLRASKINPNNASLQYNLGKAMYELGDFVEALKHYHIAIKLMPTNPAFWLNLGQCFFKMNLFNDSLLSFDKVIDLNPEFADAYYNRGSVFHELNIFDEALKNYDKAIELNANFEQAYLNRGNLLQELYRFEEALESYEKTIYLNPNSAQAYYAEGNALKALGRFNEAIARFRKSISIKPDYADAHWNLSICNLTLGNFDEGWQGYEWGLVNNQRVPKRTFIQPRWFGNVPIKGKSILIYTEQGIGDIIQFTRFIPELKKLGAFVILESPNKLLSLLNTLSGFDVLIEERSELVINFDFYCPLLSLPLALKISSNNIPNTSPYLHPNLEYTGRIKNEMSKSVSNRDLLVGISWRSEALKVGPLRSIQLRFLIQKLDLKNIQFINLQYGDCLNEISEIENEFGITIYQSSVDNLNDIEGLAALISVCDLIISIDNTTAHIAGALGKDTRVLLPFSADWRWLLDIEYSNWYPSMKLYRQQSQGNWEITIDNLKSDIAKLA